jgi:transposase
MGDLSALKDALFPNAVGMVLDRLTEVDGVVVAEAHSAVLELRCPSCATASRRVHSRYGRRLAEYPVGGRRVAVKLEVRRFFCNAPACGRRTFVEQVEGLTTRHARAGPSVKALWRSVALVAGGRPGMRLCNSLAVPTGRARLLGQLHAPEVPSRSPRVLGVDDFAFRRSRTYGTILVDVERSAPVDLLADRTSETLAAWLTAHPAGTATAATAARLRRQHRTRPRWPIAGTCFRICRQRSRRPATSTAPACTNTPWTTWTHSPR